MIGRPTDFVRKRIPENRNIGTSTSEAETRPLPRTGACLWNQQCGMNHIILSVVKLWALGLLDGCTLHGNVDEAKSATSTFCGGVVGRNTKSTASRRNEEEKEPKK